MYVCISSIILSWRATVIIYVCILSIISSVILSWVYSIDTKKMKTISAGCEQRFDSFTWISRQQKEKSMVDIVLVPGFDHLNS